MIYLDSSVALAYLLAEPRSPRSELLAAPLVSSRLLEYQVWTRLHARGVNLPLQESARTLLAGVQLIEMNDAVLERALLPLPVVVRTLDALHLATMEYLRRSGEPIELASYDNRLVAAAEAMGFTRVAL